ncbi:unnamed protein product [Callosobruchus maculatus]|uniref:Uncharacterized protein n=1 Tax=Callosobruchus maculatus TaxID=64391 RepID=A0A653D0M2_CALMS|nr:unnamed protein product [Callosobruchus maculatus]
MILRKCSTHSTTSIPAPGGEGVVMPIRYKGLDIQVQYAKGCLNNLDTKDVGRAMCVPDIDGWKVVR